MTRPDLDAIRARCEAAQVIYARNSVVAPCVYDDIPALLAYIGELERDLLNERATFESCNRARQHCEHECATLKARTTYTVGETEWAHRIATLEQELRDARAAFESCNRARRHCEDECASLRARACITNDAGEASLINTLEHMLAEERENVDTLRAAVEHAEQRFVDEYDAHQETRTLLTNLYMKQLRADAAQMREYGISYDGVRKVLAEYDGGELSLGKVVELFRAAARELAKEEIAELKARITTLEAMKP